MKLDEAGALHLSFTRHGGLHTRVTEHNTKPIRCIAHNADRNLRLWVWYVRRKAKVVGDSLGALLGIHGTAGESIDSAF